MRESLLPRKDTYLAKVTAQVKGARRASVGELTQLSRSNSHGEGAVVVPFLREQYATQLRHQLGLLNPQLRGFFRGVVPLRRPGGGLLLLVDRRKGAGFLAAEEALLPAAGLQEVAAEPSQAGVSCASLCQLKGLRCDAQQLEFANDCVPLLRHFPCEAGCGHQVGTEIPCYVHDAQRDTGHQCLTTDEAVSDCNAAHPATRRLCACVP